VQFVHGLISLKAGRTPRSVIAAAKVAGSAAGDHHHDDDVVDHHGHRRHHAALLLIIMVMPIAITIGHDRTDSRILPARCSIDGLTHGKSYRANK
jgi:hypothetical protein